MSATDMHSIVEEYLAFRRKLGFALLIEGQELGRFARFAAEIHHAGPITVDLAVRWATLPPRADRRYHARRLDMVRRLARHQSLADRSTQIPPEGMLGPSYRRLEPHIYSEGEIAALLGAAADLGPVDGLRPHTFVTLFALLACTGLRISEALRLRPADVDLDAGVITIAAGKFHRTRIVPLHPTATAALARYVARRDSHARRRHDDAFFVSEHGTSLKYIKVIVTFTTLRRRLSWQAEAGVRAPRIHDLRHTFAVNVLLRWCQEDGELDRKIASLSTYLGHVKVSDTYWYLSATPTLLGVTAARFERYAGHHDLRGEE